MLLKDLLSKFEGLDPETTEIFLSDNTTQMTAVGISEEINIQKGFVKPNNYDQAISEKTNRYSKMVYLLTDGEPMISKQEWLDQKKQDSFRRKSW